VKTEKVGVRSRRSSTTSRPSACPSLEAAAAAAKKGTPRTAEGSRSGWTITSDVSPHVIPQHDFTLIVGGTGDWGRLLESSQSPPFSSTNILELRRRQRQKSPLLQRQFRKRQKQPRFLSTNWLQTDWSLLPTYLQLIDSIRLLRHRQLQQLEQYYEEGRRLRRAGHERKKTTATAAAFIK
jgi:hypothetical protein